MDFDTIVQRWQARKNLTAFGVEQFLTLVDEMANRPMQPDVLIMHPDAFKLFYPGDDPMTMESTSYTEPNRFYSLWEQSQDRAGLTEMLTAPEPELIPITGKELVAEDFRDLWEYMTGSNQ